MQCEYCMRDTVSDASTDDDPCPCMNPNCFGQEYEEDPKGLRYKMIYWYGRSETEADEIMARIKEEYESKPIH